MLSAVVWIMPYLAKSAMSEDYKWVTGGTARRRTTGTTAR